ncbi:MAG: hypothetical protein QM802_00860 [Agriterribacter sp.]
MNAEQERLQHPEWKKWGSYVSDRQWGTVREDYSANGDAWKYTTHEMARSKTWRWGEEAIAGICDVNQLLCFGIGLWNKRDPIIKERLFGLDNHQGNHGEDVKELYYYIDATPTHSYMKMLYKYPQEEFPYRWLVDENAKRSKQEEEFEIIDTGIFNDNKYFDVFVEYAKANADDICIKISIYNRSNETASLLALPTVWFRNTWTWGRHPYKPSLYKLNDHTISLQHEKLEMKYLYFKEGNALFCDNETNNAFLYGGINNTSFPKDGINDCIIHAGHTVNPGMKGTKTSICSDITIPAGDVHVLQLRLSNKQTEKPFDDYEQVFQSRIHETDEFYKDIQQNISNEEEKAIQRQAFAGMLWNKQYYYYKVQQWLEGDPSSPKPPPERWKAETPTGNNSIMRILFLFPTNGNFPGMHHGIWAFIV